MAKRNSAAPNVHALLIACDFYMENHLPGGGFYPSLAGCVRDVAHVEAYLTGTLEVPAGRITKLTSTNAGKAVPAERKGAWPTYENILRAFGDLAKSAKRGDRVFIHYSGHGGRCGTAYPDLKGKDGLDEALVPIDIGNSEARYVRDLELATLLERLTDRGLVVTLVLDCCHSGGATRAIMPDAAVRGVTFIDGMPRPPGDVVLSEKVRAAWTRSAATRGLGARPGLLPVPAGYTLLAACRPSESAYEFAFRPGERNGALTYWLLDTLEALGPTTTYKDVYDRLLAKIHGQFELQTPMLEGEADRVLFGEGTVEARAAAVVIKVRDASRVVIGGGLATGLRAGTQLAVYARGESDVTSPARRKAIVEIAAPGATESEANVLPPLPKKPVAEGDQAIALGAGSAKLIRSVRLIEPDGRPAAPGNKALAAVAKAIPGNGWVDIARAPAPADFLVSVSKDGAFYELCDQAGEPIANLNPPLRVSDRSAPAAVVARLVHLAKFKAVRALENFDRNSPLRGKLGVEIVGFDPDYKVSDRIKPKPFPNPGQPPALRVGETAFLKITNRSDRVLNVVALDLGPDWSITQAFPGSENVYFEPVDPQCALALIPLTASLPEGCESGTDVIKVFATVGAPNFRVLALPSLDQPSEGRDSRGAVRGGGEPADPLDALLRTVAADRPALRALTAQASPGGDWVAVEVGVKITTAPPSSSAPAKGPKKKKAGHTPARKASKKPL